MHSSAAGMTKFFGRHTTYPGLLFGVTLALSISACTMSDTGQRVGSGVAIGAAAGALLGGSREAALGGAVVGAAGGYLVDQNKKRSSADAENRRLREENERLRQQQQQ